MDTRLEELNARAQRKPGNSFSAIDLNHWSRDVSVKAQQTSI